MESLINNLYDFINKKYCMVTLTLCVVFSLLITIAEIIIKMINFDFSNTAILNNFIRADTVMKNARLILIYLAANALVGLLLELRSRLKTIEKAAPKYFLNLIEAADSIKNVIKKAASKNLTEVLEINVYGMRHRQNMDIIKSALDDIRGKSLFNRNIKINIYYSNPYFLECLKSFNRSHSFLKMIDDHKKATEDSINSSINEIDNKRFNFVELNIRKHFDIPPFWAIQIDKNDIFWGYFMLTINKDNNSEYYQGTPNKCFHFNNASSELEGFFDWINNIFIRLDKWTILSPDNICVRFKKKLW